MFNCKEKYYTKINKLVKEFAYNLDYDYICEKLLEEGYFYQYKDSELDELAAEMMVGSLGGLLSDLYGSIAISILAIAAGSSCYFDGDTTGAILWYALVAVSMLDILCYRKRKKQLRNSLEDVLVEWIKNNERKDLNYKFNREQEDDNEDTLDY